MGLCGTFTEMSAPVWHSQGKRPFFLLDCPQVLFFAEQPKRLTLVQALLSVVPGAGCRREGKDALCVACCTGIASSCASQ